RRRVITWEDSQLLPELRKGRHASTQLDTVPDLDSQQAHRLKVRLENCYYEWSYHSELWVAVARWLRQLLPGALLPVWLVLYATVSTAAFISGPPGVLGGTAISAVVSLGLAILIVWGVVGRDLTWRGILPPTPGSFVFLITMAVLAEIAVAEAYAHQALPTMGWWAWIVFGLAVLPAVCACMLISASIF